MVDKILSPLLWAEINLDKIMDNLKSIQKFLDLNTRIMVVVKADAYGHGAVPVAQKAIESGFDFFGVARLEEGLELRRAGIGGSILIFGCTPFDRMGDILDHNLIPSIYSLEAAKELSAQACLRNKTARIHLKLDTGLGRIGFQSDTNQESIVSSGGNIFKEIVEIYRLPRLEITGVYTHFATSDEKNKAFAQRQFELFTEMLNQIRARGIAPGICHCANSGAALTMPNTQMDMVRIGISAYGYYPSREAINTKVPLFPALNLKARIVNLKTIPKGDSVGYGAEWVAWRPSLIATIPIGYADGLSRYFSTRGGCARVNGVAAPLAGRICMDSIMLDVTDIPNIKTGDTATLIESDADVIADMIGTISNEVLSTIGHRVEKFYTDEIIN